MKNSNHKKGFASMTIEDRKRIASSGGRKAHENGTAHKWTSEEAKIAGAKGGRNRAIAFNQAEIA